MSSALLLCLVVGITDGDTLKARCDTEPPRTLAIRLAEIDAPERGQPFGNRSKQHLASLCFRKKAEVRPTAIDRYGRTVARVACQGIDANAAMVRAGFAWGFTKYLTDPGIAGLESQARSAALGLWVDASPVPPWDWRSQANRRSSIRGGVGKAEPERLAGHPLASGKPGSARNP
jgi:micrococcal nuclease